jgi:hypothetical protein
MVLDDVRAMQGRVVSVALSDHSRLDEVTVLGVIDCDTLWLHSGGHDVFLPASMVVGVWQSVAHPSHYRE